MTEKVKEKKKELERDRANIKKNNQQIKEIISNCDRKLPKGMEAKIDARKARIRGLQSQITAELRTNADETVISEIQGRINNLQVEIDDLAQPTVKPPVKKDTTDSVIETFKLLGITADQITPEILKDLKNDKDIKGFSAKKFLEALKVSQKPTQPSQPAVRSDTIPFGSIPPEVLKTFRAGERELALF